MMDSHSSESSYRTGTTSELFICFTSLLSSSSSSSMKIPPASKSSILSPARARDPPASLPTSLSRRLRTNGSIKGGQSPMFPTGGGGGKKRGCNFENPEPSSPKVTCIGQVRVKTKKQGKKIRTLSNRRPGDASFRRVEQQQIRQGQGAVHQVRTPNCQGNANNSQECLPSRNHRWVHLPLTICEALRAFGAEFSCLFPCGSSSCFSSTTSERGKEEKFATGSREETDRSSCGTVFGRWLVALHEGDGGGRGREIELVVGGEEEGRTEAREGLLRRRADEKFELKDATVEEEEARVSSICIPPKNALLLMRCRSDPVKMSALANRSWESPAPTCEEEDEEEENAAEGQHEEVDEGEVLKLDSIFKLADKEEEVSDEEEIPEEAEATVVTEEVQEEEIRKENPEEGKLEINIVDELPEEEIQQPAELREEKETLGAEEVEFNGSSSGAVADPEKLDSEDATLLFQERQEVEEEDRGVVSNVSFSVVSALSDLAQEEEEEEEVVEEEEADAFSEEATLAEEATVDTSTDEKETQESPPPPPPKEEEEEETVTRDRDVSETEQIQPHKEGGLVSEDREEDSGERESKLTEEEEEKEEERESSSSVLPDCLLLMRCEPKLSMEVSKETWVCSADFIRWLPERPVNTNHGRDEGKKKTRTACNIPAPPPNPAHHQQLQQPPRSSCSFPAAVAGVSMATMIEEKLVKSEGYEPFVLTRCKSAPLRTAAAAKLAPETCFWKNRRLEPHHRATIGVGAAGVGF